MIETMPAGRQEDKTMDLADKIERLINDGNKEVLERIGNLETGQNEFRAEMGEMEKRIGNKIDAVHANLKTEIKVTADALKDDFKEKIEDHVRLAQV